MEDGKMKAERIGLCALHARLKDGIVLLTAILVGGAVPLTVRAAEDALKDTAASRMISFSQAVEIALAQNSALLRAENDLALNQTAVSQAQMRFLPDLRLSVSGSENYTKSSGETREDDAGLSSAGSSNSAWDGSCSAGLSSSLTLFDGFANIAELRGACLEKEAGLAEMERTRQTVVFQVVSGYLTMIEAQEQLRVREENLAAQKEQEELVATLVELGERPIADLYQQQANTASAELSVVQARRALELSRIDLVQILQLDPAGEYRFEIPELPEEDSVAAELELATLIEDAFLLRPDLAALTDRTAAAKQNERAAGGGRWPSVSLATYYGTRYGSGAGGDFGDQLEDHQSGSVSLTVSLPLFDRYATQHEIERAKVGTSNTEIALADLHQDIALQVRAAVLDWSAAREELQAAGVQVRAAGQALAATQERYAAGAATLYEVTLSRADWVAAASGQIRARYNLMWQGRLLDYYVGSLDPEGNLWGAATG
jgi:outer membrane protein